MRFPFGKKGKEYLPDTAILPAVDVTGKHVDVAKLKKAYEIASRSPRILQHWSDALFREKGINVAGILARRPDVSTRRLPRLNKRGRR